MTNDPLFFLCFFFDDIGSGAIFMLDRILLLSFPPSGFFFCVGLRRFPDCELNLPGSGLPFFPPFWIPFGVFAPPLFAIGLLVWVGFSCNGASAMSSFAVLHVTKGLIFFFACGPFFFQPCFPPSSSFARQQQIVPPLFSLRRFLQLCPVSRRSMIRFEFHFFCSFFFLERPVSARELFQSPPPSFSLTFSCF